MDTAWRWIAGIIVTLLLIALVAVGSPGRAAHYRALRGFDRRTATTQSQIEAPLQGTYILHLLAVRQRR
jgi:hypothetical protein